MKGFQCECVEFLGEYGDYLWINWVYCCFLQGADFVEKKSQLKNSFQRQLGEKLRARETAHKSAMEELAKKVDSLETELSAAKTSLMEKQSEVEKVSNRSREIRRDLESLESTHRDVQSELQRLRGANAELRDQITQASRARVRRRAGAGAAERQNRCCHSADSAAAAGNLISLFSHDFVWSAYSLNSIHQFFLILHFYWTFLLFHFFILLSIYLFLCFSSYWCIAFWFTHFFICNAIRLIDWLIDRLFDWRVDELIVDFLEWLFFFAIPVCTAGRHSRPDYIDRAAAFTDGRRGATIAGTTDLRGRSDAAESAGRRGDQPGRTGTNR